MCNLQIHHVSIGESCPFGLLKRLPFQHLVVVVYVACIVQAISGEVSLTWAISHERVLKHSRRNTSWER